MADMMMGGKSFHLDSSSANSGSIAAHFAAPLMESLDFLAKFEIVRSLSWALDPSKDGFFSVECRPNRVIEVQQPQHAGFKPICLMKPSTNWYI